MQHSMCDFAGESGIYGHAEVSDQCWGGEDGEMAREVVRKDSGPMATVSTVEEKKGLKVAKQ